MGITTEQLKALFGETELSEDTIVSMKLMVEDAIKVKVDEAKAESASELEALREQAEAYSEYAQRQYSELMEQVEAYSEYALDEHKTLMEQANDYAKYVVEEMTNKVDAYAEYVVEKFIEDNKQTLVESDEYARMKSTFNTIKEAFEGAFFQLTPTDKTVELEGELKEAKDQYNEIFGKYKAVVAENEEMQFAMVFESLTKDLADTQKEKLKALIEHVSFDSVAEFKRGVELMIGRIDESSTPPKADEVVEPTKVVVQEEVDPASPMTRYLKVL